MHILVKIGTAALALSVADPALPTARAFGNRAAPTTHSVLIEQSGKDHRHTLVQLFNTNPGQPQSTPNIKQLQQSAEQGDPNAEYLLGLAYDVGVGAPQDFAEAGSWYRKAADQGHAGAQFNLGHLYADGRGVPQDFVQAHMWLNLAAAGSQPGARNERELVAKKMTGPLGQG